MDKVAVMKSDTLLHLEDNRRAEERSRLDCADLPQSSLTDGENTDLLRCEDATENSCPVKYRRYGSRLGGVKVRHKRQVLQDMARPLKHWLYKHRDNPYPTKTEKVLLALGSHMTLVQGNAERLSVCSDDSDSDDEECPLQTPISQSDFGRSSSHKNVLQKQGSVIAMADSANSDDSASPPSKYKSSLLNRYLNDTLRHMMAAKADGVTSARKRRSHSESFSSNECDRDVVSPASSYETEANFVYHMDTVDYTSTKCDREKKQERGQQRRVDQGWREIHAAVALTNLAQGQSCTADQSGVTLPSVGTAQSCTREPFSVTRTTIIDRMCVTGPTSALRQSCTAGPTLTSRIIQKSSHISEVQTVNVALANSV
ncbi:Homeobox protein Mohawk [Nibea albiflora]|uniref:Homeobox protein Mohawk n=1 Tax=Nibea albiflora TaxID=240163 RepID=A0ACB7FHF4_NIBAL|nr:Homeobox protein Mohawk [Nibea albiflora]